MLLDRQLVLWVHVIQLVHESQPLPFLRYLLELQRRQSYPCRQVLRLVLVYRHVLEIHWDQLVLEVPKCDIKKHFL